MKREHLYYAMIGGGALVILFVVIWQLWPEPTEPISSPEVITQQLNSQAPTEEKVKAAREFIRHGPKARVEVRAALDQHEKHEPEVVAPLLQATIKNRDYRSMPTLLELLEHSDPKIRARAGAAVTRILGADIGFDALAPPDERARVIKMIKDDYEQSKVRFPEVYKEQTK